MAPVLPWVKVFHEVAAGAWHAPVLACTCAKGLAVGVTLLQGGPAGQPSAASLPASPNTQGKGGDLASQQSVDSIAQALPACEEGLAGGAEWGALRLMLLRQGQL